MLIPDFLKHDEYTGNSRHLITNYRGTATSRLVMNNYLLPVCSSDDESTRLSKSLLAMFRVNDNIKWVTWCPVLADTHKLSFSYPIAEAVSLASAACDINICGWSESKKHGVWTRTATAWKKRSASLGVEWGTHGKPGGRQAEVTAKIKLGSGATASCRPLELLNTFPAPLPVNPSQVFVVTIASELTLGSHQKAQTWVQDVLDFRLRMSERVVRTSIEATPPGTTRALIHQFLLPPMSLLHNSDGLSISNDAYDKYWPNSTVRALSDSKRLQELLDSGAGQTSTLLLLAHQAYDHLGWVGWAHLMRNMSDDSSFGIAYMYVFSPFIVEYSDLYSGPTKMLNVVEIVLYMVLTDSTISSHSPMHRCSCSQTIFLP